MENILSILLICCTSFIGPGPGIFNGELNDCPPTPNCVSTSSWKLNPVHNIRPFTYNNSTPAKEYQKLEIFLNENPNVYLKDKKEYYILAYYFTPLFHFPDKVEFLFHKDKPEIQARSASMFGIWDVFHNRVRLEYIRNKMNWM